MRSNKKNSSHIICNRVAGTLGKKRGAASALIILLIVLLVFFSILALATAAADLRLAQRRADWAGQYYLADGNAEHLVARIDQVALRVRQGQLPEDETTQQLVNLLQSADSVQTYQGGRSQSGWLISARIFEPALAAQGIELQLEMLPGAGEPHERIRVLSWVQWQPPMLEDETRPTRWDGD